ncbi:MAG: LPXTG cell wall anchor domain-containing protein [Streptomyces sp.]|uniref:LAETG motif-containing sortase-dependent surface protein n=1 Tax=Streptomyces sp. B93 TaxID=2824875 RepID=UPI0019A66BD4|nr:LAETG motif-containing sortase-dependent surface protein [Streptomyces sp. B93]MBC7269712.1 LPXTG cell wall anchor domain-containing protein [Streptomyces sp.]MBQ1092699.1 LPXTG cell wall anchor domain-containing protein [Streptomyces sp. B93]
MSIARRVTVRRLLGTGAATLALCAASASATAWATGSHGGGDGWGSGGSYKPGTGAGTQTATDRCQFSLDGTAFFDSVKVDDQNLKPGADGKVHITVRAAGGATSCTASLASYLAHGATFATSGEQVFVDFDTVTVKPGATDTLDIAVPDAGCFAQVDLYRGAVKFDGLLDANDGFEHGELPKGPDRPVIKDKLIAAWNGGTKDCTTEPTPEPSTPDETEDEGTPTPTPTEDEGTPSEEAPTPTPTEATDTPSTDAPTPSASESSAAPAPSTNGGDGDLAETGASSTTGPIALGAAVLLAGGAAIVVTTRRRKARA